MHVLICVVKKQTTRWTFGSNSRCRHGVRTHTMADPHECRHGCRRAILKTDLLGRIIIFGEERRVTGDNTLHTAAARAASLPPSR